MKSQKGITMISLVLYVASFVAVTAVVAGVTTFFYSNMQIMDTTIGCNSAYNKFNLYMINECKKPGVKLFAIKAHYENDIGDPITVQETANLGTISPTLFDFITFKTDNVENAFIYDNVNGALYYNSIKLCDNVQDFKVKIDRSTGKDILNVLINIDGTAFQTNYVVGS